MNKKRFWLLLPLLLVVGWFLYSNPMGPFSGTDPNNPTLPKDLVQELNKKREARQKLIKEDPAFFTAVSAAIFQADPVGINNKTNTDEYDLEAGELIPRLKGCHSAEDVTEALHDVFVETFDATEAGSKSGYRKLGGTIWDLWRKKQGSPEGSKGKVINDA